MSVTVTPDPTNVPPRMEILVTGSPGATVAITRTDPDGRSWPVRSAEHAVLIGGEWAGFDYESPFFPSASLYPGGGVFPGGGLFPFGASLTYSAAPSDSSTPFTATVSPLTVGVSWLIHPGVPDLSTPIYKVMLSDTDTESGVTLHAVMGRETPIPVSDGRRKSKTLTVNVTTLDAAGTAAMEAIIRDTTPLLLQVVYPFTTASLYWWLNVGRASQARVSGQFGDGRRRFTLECTVVDRPAGGIAAQRTWADVMDEAATWADVLNLYSTWADELTG